MYHLLIHSPGWRYKEHSIKDGISTVSQTNKEKQYSSRPAAAASTPGRLVCISFLIMGTIGWQALSNQPEVECCALTRQQSILTTTGDLVMAFQSDVLWKSNRRIRYVCYKDWSAACVRCQSSSWEFSRREKRLRLSRSSPNGLRMGEFRLLMHLKKMYAVCFTTHGIRILT